MSKLYVTPLAETTPFEIPDDWTTTLSNGDDIDIGIISDPDRPPILPDD